MAGMHGGSTVPSHLRAELRYALTRRGMGFHTHPPRLLPHADVREDAVQQQARRLEELTPAAILGGPTHNTASRPFFSMSVSSFRVAPRGCFSPRSSWLT